MKVPGFTPRIEPSLHEVGAKRHGLAWLRANERLVDNLGDLSPSSPWAKKYGPLITLRILDGIRLDNGEHWNEVLERWEYDSMADCLRAIQGRVNIKQQPQSAPLPDTHT